MKNGTEENNFLFFVFMYRLVVNIYVSGRIMQGLLDAQQK